MVSDSVLEEWWQWWHTADTVTSVSLDITHTVWESLQRFKTVLCFVVSRDDLDLFRVLSVQSEKEMLTPEKGEIAHKSYLTGDIILLEMVRN